VLEAGRDLDKAFNDPSVVARIPYSDPEAPIEVSDSYRFNSAISAHRFGFYWASVIVANELLLCLYGLQKSTQLSMFCQKRTKGWGSQTAPLMEEPSITAIEAVKRQSRELAEHICTIGPFVKSQALLGSLESMFAIQVAISVSSGERQEWLIEQLRQMQAAIGRKTSCAFLLMTVISDLSMYRKQKRKEESRAEDRQGKS
jgi:hypothetical protein